MQKFLFAIALCVGGLLAPGCGTSSGPETFPVSGTATFNGQPISEGNIVLIPVDGATSSDAGQILGGKFDLRAKPGKKRVEIYASREGGFNAEMKQNERISYIPAHYNSQSTLNADIKTDGENKLEFVLTAAP